MSIKEYTDSNIATVQEKVYDRVRTMILKGEIRQGQRIVERQLAEKVGVSRVPVREALLRLSSDGLLTSVPRLGFLVRTYTIQDAVELYELREAIEGMAAKLAAEKASEFQLARIYQAHQAMIDHIRSLKSDDEDLSSEYDNLFHRSILEASGNKRFKRTFALFRDEHICVNRSDLGLKPTHEEHVCLRERTIARHQSIVDALKAHDGDQAEKMMREHMRIAKESVLARGEVK